MALVLVLVMLTMVTAMLTMVTVMLTMVLMHRTLRGHMRDAHDRVLDACRETSHGAMVAIPPV